MNRFGNRFVSIALAAIMIIFALPLSALAQEPLAADYSCDTTAYDINSDSDQKAVAKEMEEKAGLGILEIESLREESSKHFQLEDGSYQAIAYGMAVHRKDANGKWQDIDNRLYNDPNAEDRYSTDDGRFSFASVSSSNTLYAVNDGEYTISFGLLLEGMSPSNAMIENHPDRLAIAQSLEGKEKLEALINIDTTTKVVYNQILENMNLEYVITGNDIKEDIILSSPTNVEGVAFSMSLNGLYAELSEDGHIKLIDDKDGKEIYSIAAPYMYDAAGEESWDIAYTITESNGVYTIGLVVDDEWIHDSDRVFPVVIDPSLTKTITTDTYISSGSPSINYGSSTELWVSSSKITYMKASMPTLPTYGKITYATLTAKYYFSATSGSMDIGLHRCMRSWSETSLTWNTANSWTNKGLESTESAAATATASSGMSSTNPGTVSFSITSLVKGWYAGNSNYGVGLKYKNGSLSSVRLHSRESTSSYRPYFSITYSVISNPVIQNGTYFLENKKTGRYIDVEDNQFSEGAYTHQWEFLGISSQKRLISYTHDANYYTIKAASSSSFYMRVKDDSPNADIRIVLSEGLDSNSTKTLTNGMIWDFSKTSSGAYKIGAKVGESNNRVLAVGSYILNINGIDVEQRNYSNNTDYIDEWIIIPVNNTVSLEAQKQTEWCWAASARMSSKEFMLSPISQESAAVYVKLGVKTATPTSTQIANSNQSATVGETEKALEYILSSSNIYSKWGKIYNESTLRSLLSSSNPVVILRGWYDSSYNRQGGHYVIIYGYHWDSTHGVYLYHIYDPWPVNTGASYSQSYQSICNGRNPAFSGDMTDTGVWEGIVVYERGSYTNTINWPNP